MNAGPNTQLTVLFADICRSTFLFDQLGDESALALGMDALQLAASIITENQGTVIGTIGDQVMCTFKAPESALHTANEIHRQIKAQTHMQKHHLAMRIGINHGPVVASRDSVYGDAVNVAARLAQQAKAHQSLVTASTITPLIEKFSKQLRPLGMISLQGKAGMVEIHELLVTADPEEITEVVNPEKKQARAYLLTVRYLGREFRFDPMLVRFMFGRSADCDQPVSHTTISREHAELTYRNGQFELRDFSTNGSQVLQAGKVHRVHRSRLVLQDKGEIYLGQTIHQRQFRIEFTCHLHR